MSRVYDLVLTKVGRLRRENEIALAASIARIERNLESKVANTYRHLAMKISWF